MRSRVAKKKADIKLVSIGELFCVQPKESQQFVFNFFFLPSYFWLFSFASSSIAHRERCKQIVGKAKIDNSRLLIDEKKNKLIESEQNVLEVSTFCVCVC